MKYVIDVTGIDPDGFNRDSVMEREFLVAAFRRGKPAFDVLDPDSFASVPEDKGGHHFEVNGVPCKLFAVKLEDKGTKTV